MRIEMAVSDVLSLFSSRGRLIESVEEFNSACEHVVLLLEEAELVFQRGGYSTATFLAITAIEETAKANLGAFTSGGPDPESRKNNIFYDHGKKHQMAAMPTVSMGQRLQAAIGEEALVRILEKSQTKELLGLRESSLYFERRDGTFRSPRTAIDKNLSRSILLYAIEVFDDALVGFTDYSMKISGRTDEVFSRVASA
jgi:AbiV family abortive infection protein